MASLISRTGGRFEIQLRVGPSRHTIRLGKASRRAAETVKSKIEALALARELGVEPDVEVAVWLDRVAGDKLRQRISNAGLAPERQRVYDVSLRSFADAFLADYTAGNAGTKLTIGVAFKRLTKHFGDDRPMRSITAKAAMECREALVASGGLGEASAATTVKKARQLWAEALKRGVVTANVWLDVRAGSQDNPDNSFYVSKEMIQRVMAQCPTDEWRIIVALCRFGGLRCPSEHLRLRRGDIDWANDRFRVRGKGKLDRDMPILPELRPHLEAAAAAVKPTATHLIANRYVTGTAWRNRMTEWIEKAGLTPWPRLFHNLRASCETDLVADGHPLHVVGKWLGHSEAIMRRHYLQPREVDFEKASKSDVKSEERDAEKERRRKGAG